MPINSIISQPAINSLNTAYRPVSFTVNANATDGKPVPPVVYCDVYLNGVFYKTHSNNQCEKVNTNNSEWKFDIEDTVQEFLGKLLGDNGGTVILTAAPVIAKVLCKFRSSGYDADGLIKHEGTTPIQGIGTTPPVAGDGTLSNEFFVLNAVLQHEDNQVLADHLNSFKTGTWSQGTFPLTHRPKDYFICCNGSDYFPFVDTVDKDYCLTLNYRKKGDINFTQVTTCTPPPICVKVSFVPPVLPDAKLGVLYKQTIQLNGTAPFLFLDEGIPAWMKGSISGNILTLQGVPFGTTGLQAVDFSVENCGGNSNFQSFSQDINITDAGIKKILINIDYIANPTPGVSKFKIYRNGILDIEALTTLRDDVHYYVGENVTIEMECTASFGYNYIQVNKSGIFYKDADGDAPTTLSVDFVVEDTLFYSIVAKSTNN